MRLSRSIPDGFVVRNAPPHAAWNQISGGSAEKLNLVALGRAALRKHTLDAAWGSFIDILSFVCGKQGVYFAKLDARGTSQVCPQWGMNCGQKKLSRGMRSHPCGERVHHCWSCGYTQNRDIASAEVVRQCRA